MGLTRTKKPQYPITVRCDDDDDEGPYIFDNEGELAQTLEWFDSEDPEQEATAHDAHGRRVRILVIAHDLVAFELQGPDAPTGDPGDAPADPVPDSDPVQG